MTMENPMGADAGAGMEKMLRTFIDSHPEYKEKNFTDAELHDALAFAQASSAQGSNEEVLQRALDARAAVREVAGKTPVVNPQSEVIGLAAKADEGTMLRNDQEGRDLHP